MRKLQPRQPEPCPAFPVAPTGRCFASLGKLRLLRWRSRCTRADYSPGMNGRPRLLMKSSARKRPAIPTPAKLITGIGWRRSSDLYQRKALPAPKLCTAIARPGTTPPTVRHMVRLSSCNRTILHRHRERRPSPLIKTGPSPATMLRSPSLLAVQIFPPPLRPQRAGGAFTAAIAPVVTSTALAEIAGVGVFADQIDQPCPAELIGEFPRVGLVQPHQRHVQFETLVHS